MTAQEIIKSLRQEGRNASQISEILGVSNIKEYERGEFPAYRIELRIKKNYKIHQLIKKCDEKDIQMGRKFQK